LGVCGGCDLVVIHVVMDGFFGMWMGGEKRMESGVGGVEEVVLLGVDGGLSRGHVHSRSSV